MGHEVFEIMLDCSQINLYFSIFIQQVLMGVTQRKNFGYNDKSSTWNEYESLW
jgi:hypothetical protein